MAAHCCYYYRDCVADELIQAGWVSSNMVVIHIYICVFSSSSCTSWALYTILPIHTKIPSAVCNLVPQSAKTQFRLGFCIYPYSIIQRNLAGNPQF